MKSPLPETASLMDHVVIGGKLTVFVLCYGDYPDLARSCLGSILDTFPIDRMDLRVGLNAACDATRAYVKSLPTTKVYEDASNAGKYVLMRKMFHDPTCPIGTTHLVWFDDDTRIIVGDMWQKLAEAIVASYSHGVRLYGWTMGYDLAEEARPGYDPICWFKEAAWWRGKDLHAGLVAGQTAPNGSFIHFVPGWFWCMATEMIVAADIPDVRLVHNGGDIVIGEAVRQAGGKLRNCNANKEYVWCPTRENGGHRGKITPVPWRLRR